MNAACDALIIGGGPAGGVAATLLARAGWSVIVLERKSFPRRKVCGEYLSATNWPLLTELGLAEAVDAQAGPEVRRVGLFVGDQALTADLPLSDECGGRWGRALSREKLDTLLLAEAAKCGAQVWQPCDARSFDIERDGFTCRAESTETGETHEVSAAVVIAAHGSWDPGDLPSQPARQRPAASDLLGFKAHFRQASLPDELMPLLCFPGGYGGLVHTDDGRVSLSCCVRRDRLERLPRPAGGCAGAAVQAHLEATTAAVRRILQGATLDGRWLAAGAIRPGIRSCYEAGVFRVGNAAGEAHPAVAEGISMALQSGKLLADRLAPHLADVRRATVRDAVGRAYAAAWQAGFARRIHVSNAVAHWAMRPTLVRACVPLMNRFPSLLTWGARHSGKIAATYVTPTLTTARPAAAAVE